MDTNDPTTHYENQSLAGYTARAKAFYKIHWTMTGYWAGRTYCGAARVSEDVYMHPLYSEEGNVRIMDDPHFCPKCASIYKELSDPECDLE